MAKKSLEEKQRDKRGKELTVLLRASVDQVLSDTGIESQGSLHGQIGHKNEFFVDTNNAVIHSAEDYVSTWLAGMERYIVEKVPVYARNPSDSYYRQYYLIKTFPSYRQYLHLFLKRTYLRNFPAYNKKKPLVKDSELWIGQNNANYGLLITPRFNGTNWENDKSEIRHFKKDYWSIGHIMTTGLVVPNKKKVFPFITIKDYLDFFTDVIVRNSGSEYEYQIAEMYSDFVLNHENPEAIPVLIPELRYLGLTKKHKHRLDFTIIESTDFKKVGFELSPWSSHGRLKGVKGKTQKAVNQEAQANFQKEINKLRKYYQEHGIYTLIYSDEDFTDLKAVFEDMKKYLEPSRVQENLCHITFEDILASNL